MNPSPLKLDIQVLREIADMVIEPFSMFLRKTNMSICKNSEGPDVGKMATNFYKT